MITLLLLSIFLLSSQQEKRSVSPDGNFSISVEAKELADSQSQYSILLIDNRSDKSIEISNCTLKDLPSPNFYWDKNSQFLIFEQSNDSFNKAIIKVLNLKTQRIDIELPGLIGNNDREGQQYDSDNEIIIYFSSSNSNQKHIPQLYSHDLKSKKTRVLFNFDTRFEMDFPTIKRITGKRELILNYSDVISGNHTKLIAY